MLTKTTMQEIQDLKLQGLTQAEIIAHYKSLGIKPPSRPTIALVLLSSGYSSGCFLQNHNLMQTIAPIHGPTLTFSKLQSYAAELAPICVSSC